jgi:acid phosphatase family membrane protein YuiD
MPSVLDAWFGNRVFLAWFIACIVSQLTKIILGTIEQRRFDFRWFLGTGGMPSTHVAGVTALTTSVGIHVGVDSALFASTLVFTIITMFDAQGVRRWSGRQAQVLNKMLEDMYFKRRIQEERLKELLGHTPTEVFAGMGVGLVTAFVIH